MYFGCINFLWLGTKILGLRRESRPSDPLGIGPDASTFGNNLGTCAVLAHTIMPRVGFSMARSR